MGGTLNTLDPPGTWRPPRPRTPRSDLRVRLRLRGPLADLQATLGPRGGSLSGVRPGPRPPGPGVCRPASLGRLGVATGGVVLPLVEVQRPEADEEARAAGHAAAGLQGAVPPGVAPHLHARPEARPAAPVEAGVARGEAVALHVVPVVLEAPEHAQAHAALPVERAEGQPQGGVVAGVGLQRVVQQRHRAPGQGGAPGAARYRAAGLRGDRRPRFQTSGGLCGRPGGLAGRGVCCRRFIL